MIARLDKPAVFNVMAARGFPGEVALCGPVLFELGHIARTPADYTALMLRLSAYARFPTTDGDHRRALEVQAALIERSQHRGVSLVDALVAAVAEARDLTVLHYDADFELIAAITGQAHAWVVPRGTAD